MCMVNRKKNGDVFVVEKAITPLRDKEGRITHFISNDRDITDQRRLETQLQQAQKWTQSEGWQEAWLTTSIIC